MPAGAMLLSWRLSQAMSTDGPRGERPCPLHLLESMGECDGHACPSAAPARARWRCSHQRNRNPRAGSLPVQTHATVPGSMR